MIERRQYLVSYNYPCCGVGNFFYEHFDRDTSLPVTDARTFTRHCRRCNKTWTFKVQFTLREGQRPKRRVTFLNQPPMRPTPLSSTRRCQGKCKVYRSCRKCTRCTCQRTANPDLLNDGKAVERFMTDPFVTKMLR
jgi:hypothetical protein